MPDTAQSIDFHDTDRPLVFDVDGTMIRSDLTHELFLEGAKAYPWRIPALIADGIASKSKLKQWIVSRVGGRLRPDLAPLEPKALALAEGAKRRGRAVYLCSGSEQSLVVRLADTLPFVDGAFGTTPDYNMTSHDKAAFLRKRFPDGFDYVGNSTQDYAVWDVAQTGYAIRPPTDTPSRKSAMGQPIRILEPRRTRLGPLWRSLRPWMWWRPLLVAIPVVTLAVVSDWVALWALEWPWLFGGVAALAALESAAFLTDDALDVHRDRASETKRKRPMAAGTLSITSGLGTAALLGLSSLGLALWLPEPFLWLWAIHAALLALRGRLGGWLSFALLGVPLVAGPLLTL